MCFNYLRVSAVTTSIKEQGNTLNTVNENLEELVGFMSSVGEKVSQGVCPINSVLHVPSCLGTVGGRNGGQTTVCNRIVLHLVWVFS